MLAIEISEEPSARKNARIFAFCIFLIIKHLPVFTIFYSFLSIPKHPKTVFFEVQKHRFRHAKDDVLQCKSYAFAT